MMEMSRQRIAKNINDAIHLECPHCEGRGRVKSVEAMALSFLRKVHAVAAKGQISEVRGGLPLEVAYFLLNRKKRELAQIENDYEIVVTVKGKPSFLLNQLELETLRREKQSDELQDKELTLQPLSIDEPELEAPAEVADNTIPQEGSVKKRRKRKRKKKNVERLADANTLDQPGGDAASATQVQEPIIATEVEAVEPSQETKPSVRKRRRPRTRKKESDGLADVQPGVDQEVEQAASISEPPAPSVLQDEAVPAIKRPRRSRKSPATTALTVENVSVTTEAEQQAAPDVVTEPAKKKRSPSPRKKVEQEAVVLVAETVVTDVVTKPRKRPGARAKKVAVSADTDGQE
jgi:ribonuclease E